MWPHRGHDEEAVEQVFTDLAARQTNGQTTDTSNGQDGGHCMHRQPGGHRVTACTGSQGAQGHCMHRQPGGTGSLHAQAARGALQAQAVR